MTPEYHDFELDIDIGRENDFPVAVRRSPAGETRAVMHFPFDEHQLALRIKDLQIALLRSGDRRRSAPTDEQQTVQSFGAALFDALLAGEVRTLYDVSRARAQAAGAGLRIKLRIASPPLAALPWEFLYDARQREYVSLSRYTPLVRYLELPHPPRPLAAPPPLRILGLVASPRDLPEIDLAGEQERIERALAGAMEEGLVELVWMAGATWRDLQRAMRRGPWHIFHFVGHGAFDHADNEGQVMLCDDEGLARPLHAGELGRLLADHWTLRLAVLNACEGARGDQRDLFSSTAAILVQRGLPAVLAMQYEITDRAALEMARAFYEALADGLPVDAAVAEARKAVSLAVANTVEWGTPVLTMRAPDGVLFSLQQPSERRATKTTTLSQIVAAELTLRLTATPNPARQGQPVTWTVSAGNDGSETLHFISLFRGRTLLEDPFPLAAGQRRDVSFTASYGEAGAAIERISATGFTAAGRVALDEAAATVLVEPRAQPAGAPAAPGLAPLFTLRDPLTMEFVLVPAGAFLMGSDPAADPDAHDLELPQHRLRLGDYYIGRTPVTNAHYAVYVAARGAQPPPYWKGGKAPEGLAQHPVVEVSWSDALQFCRWLRKASGRQFHLPTEAHWEKAACWGRDAAARVLFPFGNVFNPARCNSYESGIGRTTPVGAYSPAGDSRYGVSDLAGNVYEWTSSLPGAYPYDLLDGRENLAASGQRVLRGGSFYDVEWVARCASRFYSNPLSRFPYAGFRVALYL